MASNPMMSSSGAMYCTPPQTYARVNYQWQGTYNRRQPFVAPYGIDPYIADEMIYASEIFRDADQDYNGVMTMNEFIELMRYLTYHIHPNEAARTFMMVDADRSGYIDEREFICFWIYIIGPGGHKFDRHHHRQHRTKLTIRIAKREVKNEIKHEARHMLHDMAKGGVHVSLGGGGHHHSHAAHHGKH